MDVSCVPESCCCSYLSLYFFIFLSLQFSNIKNFRHTFLRNVRPRRLKLGTNVDSGQMYAVYLNQAAAAYLSLFIFLSLQFSNLQIFVTLFSGTIRPRWLKLVHAWTVGRCIVYTGIRMLLLIHPFNSSFFFPIFKH